MCEQDICDTKNLFQHLQLQNPSGVCGILFLVCVAYSGWLQFIPGRRCSFVCKWRHLSGTRLWGSQAVLKWFWGRVPHLRSDGIITFQKHLVRQHQGVVISRRHQLSNVAQLRKMGSYLKRIPFQVDMNYTTVGRPTISMHTFPQNNHSCIKYLYGWFQGGKIKGMQLRTILSQMKWARKTPFQIARWAASIEPSSSQTSFDYHWDQTTLIGKIIKHCSPVVYDDGVRVSC